MNQFVAPQFIDVEDRIIGPITTRQFVIMVIGGVIVFLSYKFLDTGSFVSIAFLVFVIVVVFGFIKINGRRFGDYMASMVGALRRPRIRVWCKQSSLEKTTGKEEDINKIVKSDLIPSKKTIKPKHLAELALLVDTGGRYQG